MQELGLRGGAFKETTMSDLAASRPADLVDRQLTASAPNQLWVSDLTYGLSQHRTQEPDRNPLDESPVALTMILGLSV
jgi:transposase InsO family protein